MTPADLLSEIQGVRSNVVDFPANVFLKFLFATMAEGVYEFYLPGGKKVSDAIDFKIFLEVCAFEAEQGGRMKAPRGFAIVPNVCPRCYHVHEQENECGVSMGGAGACDCKAEVTA